MEAELQRRKEEAAKKVQALKDLLQKTPPELDNKPEEAQDAYEKPILLRHYDSPEEFKKDFFGR